MDGENFMENQPYEQMDDFGGKYHYFWKHPIFFGDFDGQENPISSS